MCNHQENLVLGEEGELVVYTYQVETKEGKEGKKKMKGIKSRTTPSSAFAFFLPLCLYSLEGPLLLLQIHLLELYLPLTRLEPQPNVPWF